MNYSANKPTPEESENIHALFCTYMATNKLYRVEVDGYVFIAAHDQSANKFHIGRSTSVTYNLQGDVKLDINWIACRDLV